MLAEDSHTAMQASEATPLLRTFASPSAVPFAPWFSEALLLVKSSVPVILAYMLQNSLQTVSVLIAGRLGADALAAAAFSYMFAMATAWLIALGGTSAIDTLASNSFTASKDKHNVGIILQRGMIVLTGYYVVVAVIWVFSEHAFRALGQPESICVQSSRFLWLLIPGGLGYVWFECMKKYLQAQGIYHPGTYALLITSPLNALLNYVFVWPMKLGLDGAPLATGISYWLSFLYLVLYTRYIQGSQCWGGLDLSHALKNVGIFVRLSFLGVIHVGTEWWAFEIVALAAGRLGTTALAAQSVIMTLDQIINTIPFGLGVAESARLGNVLGSKDHKGARRSAHSAALLSVCVGAVLCIILLSMRDIIGRMFNDDERVNSLVAEVIPYVAIFQIADGLNGSLGGVLRALGYQWIGAAVNVSSYYCAALPGGIYLAFHGWGLSGLWMGQCVALSLVGLLEWVIVGFTNWNKEVQRGLDRLEGGADNSEVREEQGV